jgi:hypothetical protein
MRRTPCTCQVTDAFDGSWTSTEAGGFTHNLTSPTVLSTTFDGFRQRQAFGQDRLSQHQPPLRPPSSSARQPDRSSALTVTAKSAIRPSFCSRSRRRAMARSLYRPTRLHSVL